MPRNILRRRDHLPDLVDDGAAVGGPPLDTGPQVVEQLDRGHDLGLGERIVDGWCHCQRHLLGDPIQQARERVLHRADAHGLGVDRCGLRARLLRGRRSRRPGDSELPDQLLEDVQILVTHRRETEITGAAVLERPGRGDVGNARPQVSEHRPEVEHLRIHDGPGPVLVFGDELVTNEQMGEQVRPAPEERQSRPGQIEHGVAEVSQLPVEHGVDPPVLAEHEVPDAVVAVDEGDPTRRRQIATEPGQAEPDQRHLDKRGRFVHLLPALDLSTHRLLRISGTAQERQIGVNDVDRVDPGEYIDEVDPDRSTRGRVGEHVGVVASPLDRDHPPPSAP